MRVIRKLNIVVNFKGKVVYEPGRSPLNWGTLILEGCRRLEINRSPSTSNIIVVHDGVGEGSRL